MPAVSLVEAQTLGEKILMAHSVGQRNATLTIASLLRAEMEGLPSHGFSRIPYYAAQSAAGKVDGHAVPLVERPRPGVVTVDARCGFAFSAFADGLPGRRGLPRNRAWLCWPCVTRTMRACWVFLWLTLQSRGLWHWALPTAPLRWPLTVAKR